MAGHGHTHGPGEHSHTHAQPQPQPQQQVLPPADPESLAIIDADFREAPIELANDNTTAVCTPHKLEKCKDCDIDYVSMNKMSRILASNTNLRCPPPPNVVTNNLSQAINNTKEDGNKLFKLGNHTVAISRYNMAASIAVQRPPWESHQIMKDELSAIISNRSAAYYEAQDFISALADAESVIQLKRPWSKGHFRKAKALVGLGRHREAEDAMNLGLSFDPENTELKSFLEEIKKIHNTSS